MGSGASASDPASVAATIEGSTTADLQEAVKDIPPETRAMLVVALQNARQSEGMAVVTGAASGIPT